MRSLMRVHSDSNFKVRKVNIEIPRPNDFFVLLSPKAKQNLQIAEQKACSTCAKSKKHKAGNEKPFNTVTKTWLSKTDDIASSRRKFISTMSNTKAHVSSSPSANKIQQSSAQRVAGRGPTCDHKSKIQFCNGAGSLPPNKSPSEASLKPTKSKADESPEIPLRPHKVSRIRKRHCAPPVPSSKPALHAPGTLGLRQKESRLAACGDLNKPCSKPLPNKCRSPSTFLQQCLAASRATSSGEMKEGELGCSPKLVSEDIKKDQKSEVDGQNLIHIAPSSPNEEPFQNRKPLVRTTAFEIPMGPAKTFRLELLNKPRDSSGKGPTFSSGDNVLEVFSQKDEDANAGNKTRAFLADKPKFDINTAVRPKNKLSQTIKRSRGGNAVARKRARKEIVDNLLDRKKTNGKMNIHDSKGRNTTERNLTKEGNGTTKFDQNTRSISLEYINNVISNLGDVVILRDHVPSGRPKKIIENNGKNKYITTEMSPSSEQSGQPLLKLSSVPSWKDRPQLHVGQTNVTGNGDNKITNLYINDPADSKISELKNPTGESVIPGVSYSKRPKFPLNGTSFVKKIGTTHLQNRAMLNNYRTKDTLLDSRGVNRHRNNNKLTNTRCYAASMKYKRPEMNAQPENGTQTYESKLHGNDDDGQQRRTSDRFRGTPPKCNPSKLNPQSCMNSQVCTSPQYSRLVSSAQYQAESGDNFSLKSNTIAVLSENNQSFTPINNEEPIPQLRSEDEEFLLSSTADIDSSQRVPTETFLEKETLAKVGCLLQTHDNDGYADTPSLNQINSDLFKSVQEFSIQSTVSSAEDTSLVISGLGLSDYPDLSGLVVDECKAHITNGLLETTFIHEESQHGGTSAQKDQCPENMTSLLKLHSRPFSNSFRGAAPSDPHIHSPRMSDSSLTYTLSKQDELSRSQGSKSPDTLYRKIPAVGLKRKFGKRSPIFSQQSKTSQSRGRFKGMTKPPEATSFNERHSTRFRPVSRQKNAGNESNIQHHSSLGQRSYAAKAQVDWTESPNNFSGHLGKTEEDLEQGSVTIGQNRTRSPEQRSHDSHMLILAKGTLKATPEQTDEAKPQTSPKAPRKYGIASALRSMQSAADMMKRQFNQSFSIPHKAKRSPTTFAWSKPGDQGYGAGTNSKYSSFSKGNRIANHMSASPPGDTAYSTPQQATCDLSKGECTGRKCTSSTSDLNSGDERYKSMAEDESKSSVETSRQEKNTTESKLHTSTPKLSTKHDTIVCDTLVCDNLILTPDRKPECYATPKEASFFATPEAPAFFATPNLPAIFAAPREPAIYTAPKAPANFTAPKASAIFTAPKAPAIFTASKELARYSSGQRQRQKNGFNHIIITALILMIPIPLLYLSVTTFINMRSS